MAINATFVSKPDQIEFRTRTNGDFIRIEKVHLGPEAAANLSTMINTPNSNLKVKIKFDSE